MDSALEKLISQSKEIAEGSREVSPAKCIELQIQMRRMLEEALERLNEAARGRDLDAIKAQDTLDAIEKIAEGKG